MSKFYTNFYVHKSTLLVKEYDNGIVNQLKFKIKPSLYYVTNKPSEHKSIFGHNLIKMDFESTYEARTWLKDYQKVKQNIFGFPHHEYTMINQIYPDMQFNVNKLLVGVFDIETETEGRNYSKKHIIRVRKDATVKEENELYLSIGSFEFMTNFEQYQVYDETKDEWLIYRETCYYPKGGFPNTNTANEAINLISISKKRDGNTSKIMCFGWGDAVIKDKDAEYVKCRDEKHLLLEFLNYWQEEYVDVITGWSIAKFDIPYIIKRIENVLGEDAVKRLSPYDIINGKPDKDTFGAEFTRYFIAGLTVLDYLEIYKKFKPKQQESYKLDHIADVELDDRKVDYNCSFKDFYTKHYQTFVEYNIHDTRLVSKLDDKLGYISLAATIAYKAKVSLEDITGTVRVWDVLIANALSSDNIHVPTYNKNNSDAGSYGGGFVKPPIVGFYEWILSVDATSLYPSEIIFGNISPETMVDPSEFIDITPDDVINRTEKWKEAYLKAKSLNATLCANGAMFYKDKQGIIPKLTKSFFDERQYEKGLGKKYDTTASLIKDILKRDTDVNSAFSVKSLFKVGVKLEVLSADTLKTLSNADLKVLCSEYKRQSLIQYNIEQAIKILINSLYGYLGSIYSRFYDTYMAEGITLNGQTHIRTSGDSVNRFLYKLTGVEKDRLPFIHTDSVTGSTIIKVDGKDISIKEYYDSLPNDFEDSLKEIKKGLGKGLSYSIENGIEYKEIAYAMRHKVKKKMYRIKVNGNQVDVTEDHSVIVLEDGKLKSIKPIELVKGKHRIISI